MIVEIEYKKLGDIQVLTYRHVYLCENLHAMRSCKSKVAQRHACLDGPRLTVHRIGQNNILRHGFVCQKLYSEKELQVKVVCTPF